MDCVIMRNSPEASPKLGNVIGRQQDVGTLDVQVNHLLLVQEGKGAGNVL